MNVFELIGLDTFTWRQARDVGVTRYQLTGLIDSGHLRRIFRDVYQRTDVPDTLESRVAAARLILPPFGVVTDRTAAWLHGVDALAYREHEILPKLDLRVIRDFTPLRRSEVSGGSRDLDPLDVMTLRPGVQVTTPLRTALDLGCSLRGPSALATLDQFMRLHGVTTAEMLGELPRYRRRRGVIQLRRLVPWADPRAESPGESWTRYWMLKFGLPYPELQHEVIVRGRVLYRLDLAYPKHRVCVEYDGVEFHDSDDQRAADEARRSWLRENGWKVTVVTKDSLTSQRISEWTGLVNQALHGW